MFCFYSAFFKQSYLAIFMEFQKVLVGWPTAEVKSYCLADYPNGIESLTYPNFDVCIIDNSKTPEYFNKIKIKAEKFEQANEKNFFVIRAGIEIEKARKRLVFCRNLLRKKVLDEGPDFFFL